MARTVEETLKMISRLKASPDGPEFMEYLRTLSHENYQSFKADPESLNEFHKGYATSVDSILECFEKCDETLKKMEDLAEQAKKAALGESGPEIAHY